MSIARTLAFPLLAMAAAACTPRATNQAPRPLKPEDGPAASIRVGYGGGIVNRNLTAYFRTEQDAHVIVGHLGGDGVIRILYPESPDEAGRIQGKKTYSTANVAAHFDGAPSLFAYTMSPYRSLSSLYDSYDGRGHGYVFVVASRRPLRYFMLMDESLEWSDWEVAGYDRMSDPRYAVRDFAEAIARGAPYTLKFASNFSSSQYDAFASRAWDCSLLSSLGFLSFSPWFSSWQYGAFGIRNSYNSYCGGGAPYGRYAFAYRGPIVGTIIPPTPTTPGAPAPSLDRPGRRGFDHPGTEENRTRASINRLSPSPRSGTLGERDAGSTRRTGTSNRPTTGLYDRPSRTSEDRATRPTHRDRTTESPRTSGGSSASGGSSTTRSSGSSSPSGGSSTTRSSGSSSPSGGASTTRSSGGSTSSGSGSAGGSARPSERPAASSPREVRSSGGRPDQP